MSSVLAPPPASESPLSAKWTGVCCPACHTTLRDDDGALCCDNDDCGLTFPVVHGVPILIDESASVFDVESFVSSQPTFFERCGVWRTRISDLLPDTENNLAAERVFRDLRQRLAERTGRAKVLVLGGGVLGAGLSQLVDAPGIELIETDVAIEPRTQLVCDAHQVPFQDETFDAVIVQAVLEHVVDPFQCAAEIHRVLGPGGFVYADTPFMQQVHAGAYDFTRFTRLGHRRLFRRFEEVESGITVGPGSALAWSLRYFLLSFCRTQRARRVVGAFARLAFFWLKYWDRLLARRPAACDAASAFYFLGRQSNRTFSDRELIDSYVGGF
ncbi:MAG: methyltransferase domain-containing protein [Planctomycetales bacterium]|nr:methyltransferase domain-containing protein [Planctomycetales bacterium]